jgi:hypothetical protein
MEPTGLALHFCGKAYRRIRGIFYVHQRRGRKDFAVSILFDVGMLFFFGFGFAPPMGSSSIVDPSHAVFDAGGLAPGAGKLMSVFSCWQRITKALLTASTMLALWRWSTATGELKSPPL